jgi:hypothetical protein
LIVCTVWLLYCHVVLPGVSVADACPHCDHYSSETLAAALTGTHHCLAAAGVAAVCRFFTDSYSQLFFLTGGCCCRLVWALGRLTWLPPQEWSDRLFLETYAKLSSFKAAELAGESPLTIPLTICHWVQVNV